MNTNNKFDSFKKTNIYRYPQSNALPTQIFINKVLEIIKSYKQAISSSTLRMKLGDSLSKENLPPSGKFNEWMGMIKELVRDDTIQVDMPHYSFAKQNVSVPQPKNDSFAKQNVSVPQLKQNIPVVSPIVINQLESDTKLKRTINRVKVKYEEWVIEWNIFNTENPSIEQWNKLNERYNDLNKKIQTIKNFFGRHQDLIKEYYPNNMPKKPSDTLVYNVIKAEEIKTEPIETEEIKTELIFDKSKIDFPLPISSNPPLFSNSYLFPNSSLPLPPLPPPPTPPPPPSLPSPFSSHHSLLTSQSLQQYPTYSPINSEDIFMNNNSNLFPKSYEHPKDNFIPQIPNEYSNIFDNRDLYNTLLKLRNYGLMEQGSLAEKALILFEQNKKF